MGISVESRIHRTLAGLERFRPYHQWDQLPQVEGVDSPIDIDATEKLLGVYENIPGRVEQLLLLTNLAVHLWEGCGWRSLQYADIAATEWPRGAKNETRTLVLRMKSGAYERLPILGGTGSTRDVFEVMRFFDRVVEDFKQQS